MFDSIWDIASSHPVFGVIALLIAVSGVIQAARIVPLFVGWVIGATARQGWAMAKNSYTGARTGLNVRRSTPPETSKEFSRYVPRKGDRWFDGETHEIYRVEKIAKIDGVKQVIIAEETNDGVLTRMPIEDFRRACKRLEALWS